MWLYQRIRETPPGGRRRLQERLLARLARRQREELGRHLLHHAPDRLLGDLDGLIRDNPRDVGKSSKFLENPLFGFANTFPQAKAEKRPGPGGRCGGVGMGLGYGHQICMNFMLRMVKKSAAV